MLARSCKRSRGLSLIGLLLFPVFLFAQLPAQKRALIIAIGNYPYEKTGWKKISSANDVPYIMKTLENQGFPVSNISVIRDEQATKAGIIKGLQQLANVSNKGDVVLIHVSSHGEQVADNANKDEADGYDECIVPIEAVSPRQSKNFDVDQASYLRDDEFGSFIDDIRKKIGKSGDVIVLMDNCHSGSATRGSSIVRGDMPPFVPDHFTAPKPRGDMDKNNSFQENGSSIRQNDMAGYIVFSASRASEKNTETLDENGLGVGSLTYAISKVFQNLAPHTTYRSLFAKIVSYMYGIVPGQNPVMEGSETDRLLFGGRYIFQKPYFNVTRILGSEIQIDAGKFVGLDVGAKVDLYPAGTTDPTNAVKICQGNVTSSSAFRSTVTIDTVLKGTEKTDVWAFPVETAFKMSPLRLKITKDSKAQTRGQSQAVSFTAEEINKIEATVREVPQVELADNNPDLILEKGIDSNELWVASNGYSFRKLDARKPEELQEALKDYLLYRFLQIDIDDRNYGVEVKLIPVKNSVPDTLAYEKMSRSGIFEVKIGDTLCLWVKNTSNRKVYINILDLQPDGIINCVLPNTESNIYPEDLFLKSGETMMDFRKLRLVVGPPAGNELYKVFISPTPLNMERAIKTKGNTRGSLKVFEKLLKDTHDGTRGGSPMIPLGEGGTISYPIKIIE